MNIDEEKKQKSHEHCIQVGWVCGQLYGRYTPEWYVGLFHDFIEDDLGGEEHIYSSISLLNDPKKEKEVFDAIRVITRRKDETYNEYIERVKQNPLALRAKVADLITNLFLRDTEPSESLKKRYKKALGVLLQGNLTTNQ